MDIDLTGFTAGQQRALFDLLILSMYADGKLSTYEDDQLQKLLAEWATLTSLTANVNLMPQ